MDDAVRIDGEEITAAIRDAHSGHPKLVRDHEGNEGVVISPAAYKELEELRLLAQRRQAYDGINQIDAGEVPLRVFTDPAEMIAAADADRAAQRVRGAD
ncbi:hypothetical protein [Actinomadura fibrosa]|uniref:Antitoxin n=1 Tax=Actinomadura fibrosa TaxID=111802 RepID=A0ABW2XJA6_9ACTN|nr:hypothetical protein [Actinomadura fibrosa]